MPRYRLAYLVTHPIQYQAPLLRTIAREHSRCGNTAFTWFSVTG